MQNSSSLNNVFIKIKHSSHQGKGTFSTHTHNTHTYTYITHTDILIYTEVQTLFSKLQNIS